MKQVEGLRNSPRQTAPWIYEEIEEYVMDSPDATFREIVTYVSRQHGVPYNEFLKNTNGLRRYTLKAREFFQGLRKARESIFRPSKG